MRTLRTPAARVAVGWALLVCSCSSKRAPQSADARAAVSAANASVTPSASASAPAAPAVPTPAAMASTLPDLLPEPAGDPRRASHFPSAANFGLIAVRPTPAFPYVAVAGDLALVATRETRTIYGLPLLDPQTDAGSGAPGDTPSPYSAFGLAIQDEGDAVITAFDVRAKQSRWATSSLPSAEFEARTKDGTLSLNGVIACKTTLVAELAWHGTRSGFEKTDLVAFDASRGTVLWHRQISFDDVTCANDLVHVEHHGDYDVALDTLDLATGKTLVSRNDQDDVFGWRPAVAAADEIVSLRVPRNGGMPFLQIVDAASDKVRLRRNIPDVKSELDVVAMQVSGGDAFLILKTVSGTRVEAIDLTTGRLRWATNPVPAQTPDLYQWLAFDDDVVFACTSNVLRALSRRGGTVQWKYGLGSCDHLFLARADANAPATILAAEYALDPNEPKFLGRLLAFGRGDHVVPPEHATIEGKTLPGARILAGDVVVTADVSGHYRAVVDALGKVTVSGLSLRSSDGLETPVEARSVTLDGRSGPYQADIDYVNDG